MEARVCDVNHLEADVLLPPRKRLLAGLKKQNFEINSNWNSSCIESSPPAVSSVLDSRLNSLLNSHTNESNLSPEEIVETSSLAATMAAKAAKAARTLAEEKAAIAAKAMAAAKSALDLVASFSEASGSNDRYLKRNKLKKHIPVNSFYGKETYVRSCKVDEELARNLHRAMNSSPRKRKNTQRTEANVDRNKKPRCSNADEVHSLRCNDDADEMDSEGTIDDEAATFHTEDKSFKYVNNFPSKIGNRESGHSAAAMHQDNGSPNAKKRRRVKLKKLPLSICTYKDKEENANTTSFPFTERNAITPVSSDSSRLYAVKPSGNGAIPFQPASIWECQGFQGPEYVKPNKVAHS